MKQNTGTELATITVDGTSSKIYAPIVSVTRSISTGTKIASLNINGENTDLYAPNNGGGGGGGSTVSVTQIQHSGTRIADITVDGATTSLYAPSNGGGGGGSVEAWPLLAQVTLQEPVNSVVFSQDGQGNAFDLTEGFYIEAEIERSGAEGEYIEIGNGQGATKLISNTQKLFPTQQTYVRIEARQMAEGRWVCVNYTGATTYDSATGAGNNAGEVGYNSFADFTGTMNSAKVVYINAKNGGFATGSVFKIYGR